MISGSDNLRPIIWPHDPEVWERIQRATGFISSKNSDEVWSLLNDALFWTCLADSPYDKESLKNIRAKSGHLIQTIDDLINILGFYYLPGERVPPMLCGVVAGRLLPGAVRLVRPVNVDVSHAECDEEMANASTPLSSLEDEHSHDAAMAYLIGLLQRLGNDLPKLRNIAAESFDHILEQKGPGRPERTRVVRFIEQAVHVYEFSYQQPAKLGGKGSDGMTSPTVRFINAVASEVRISKTIQEAYRPELRETMSITPNAINRTLSKLMKK